MIGRARALANRNPISTSQNSEMQKFPSRVQSEAEPAQPTRAPYCYYTTRASAWSFLDGAIKFLVPHSNFLFQLLPSSCDLDHAIIEGQNRPHGRLPYSCLPSSSTIPIVQKNFKIFQPTQLHITSYRIRTYTSYSYIVTYRVQINSSHGRYSHLSKLPQPG